MKENVKVQRKRIRRKYPLPRPDVSFKKEIELIKAVVEFSEKGEKTINYKSIKIGLHPTRVSSELRYFESLSLIKGEKGKYLVDPKTVKFVNNLNWKKEQEAKKILRDIIQKVWFGDLTLKIVKTKGKVKKDELISELGTEASAHPTKDKKSIERLIEWMKYSELINIDEKQNVTIQYPTEVAKPKKVEIVPPEKEAAKIELPTSIVFQVVVTPQTTENEIKEVIRKIKKALKSEL